MMMLLKRLRMTRIFLKKAMFWVMKPPRTMLSSNLSDAGRSMKI
jgi:hypothetical protein